MTVFDDMIADMLSNKKLIAIVTELFIRGRKFKIDLIFIMQSSFAVRKKYKIRLKTLFCYEIPNKRVP